MSVVDLAQWLPAVLAVAAWPVGVVVIVLVVLVLAPRDRQAAVLSSAAELVRAARARPATIVADRPVAPEQAQDALGARTPDRVGAGRRRP